MKIITYFKNILKYCELGGMSGDFGVKKLTAIQRVYMSFTIRGYWEVQIFYYEMKWVATTSINGKV